MQKAKLGVIGIVHEQSKADFWGTMERLASLGYQGVEQPPFPSEGELSDHLKRFHDLGLKALTTSAGRETLRDDLGAVIKEAHAVQTNRVSVWWAPGDSKESVLEDAAIYNEAGAKLAAEGLTLCYHHHHHEFLNVFNGVTSFDWLAANTDPSALKFVIDIAWAAFGRQDPVALIKRLEGRVSSLHVKDLSRVDEINHFTAVGTGVVPIKESVQAALDTGVEWAVVEQDSLRNLDPFETLTISSLYLKEAGLI